VMLGKTCYESGQGIHVGTEFNRLRLNEGIGSLDKTTAQVTGAFQPPKVMVCRKIQVREAWQRE
jgi:hypothetical protein